MLADIGWVGLMIGALSILAGMVLVVMAFIGWIARGFQKGDDDDDWVV